jgi:hypothetical protein
LRWPILPSSSSGRPAGQLSVDPGRRRCRREPRHRRVLERWDERGWRRRGYRRARGGDIVVGAGSVSAERSADWFGPAMAAALSHHLRHEHGHAPCRRDRSPVAGGPWSGHERSGPVATSDRQRPPVDAAEPGCGGRIGPGADLIFPPMDSGLLVPLRGNSRVAELFSSTHVDERARSGPIR